MSAFVNSVVVGLCASIIGVALFWSFDATEDGSLPTVESVKARWVLGQDSTPGVEIQLVILNPGRLKADVVRTDWNIGVDETDEAQPALVGRVPVLPGQRHALSLRSGGTGALSWWLDMVDGATTMRVTGLVHADVGQRTLQIPFNQTWSPLAALAPSLGELAAGCDPSAPDACVASVRTGAPRLLDGTMKLPMEVALWNPASAPVSIEGLGADLVLDGVRMATGNAIGVVQLAPKSGEPIFIVASFLREALTQWWPEPVRDCDGDPLELRFSFQVRTDNGTAHATTDLEQVLSGRWFGPQGPCVS